MNRIRGKGKQWGIGKGERHCHGEEQGIQEMYICDQWLSRREAMSREDPAMIWFRSARCYGPEWSTSTRWEGIPVKGGVSGLEDVGAFHVPLVAHGIDVKLPNWLLWDFESEFWPNRDFRVIISMQGYRFARDSWHRRLSRMPGFPGFPNGFQDFRVMYMN